MASSTALSRHSELRAFTLCALVALLGGPMPSARAAVEVSQGQAVGSIRGLVYDKDFDALLPTVEIKIVETGQTAKSTPDGNFVLPDVEPGIYTLVFSKEGYVRQVRSEVVVSAGKLTEVTVYMAGDFTDMEEFVVQDVLSLGGGSEAALLELRFDSPALMDGIGADLMSRANAGDAAAALQLVSGATVEDGKFAVIRGLPDRYVSSQMNGVRMPSADENKRAVELDMFPSAIIESVQVTKTFTPDQQGDASGGAVDLRLKGIPDEPIAQFKVQVSGNSQVTGRSDFLSYDGGGVSAFGHRDAPIQYENLGDNWDGAVGVSQIDAPIDYKLSGSYGGKEVLGDGLVVGGFGSLFYERDSSFYDNGVNDSWWVRNAGDPMTPQTSQGTPEDGDFKTSLFDVTRAGQSVQWGGLASVGLESELHKLGLTYLYTHAAEDLATLAEDTRGKEYFFPGYDPYDPTGTGNDPDSLDAAPYLRTQTLEYTERTAQTLQLHGEHDLDLDSFSLGGLDFRSPTVDWTLAHSGALLDQPDKRQFGSLWKPESFNPGVPPFIPPFTSPAGYFPFKPGANFNLGNLQRIYKRIEEKSNQVSANITWPFEQWSGDEGAFKAGIFDDHVKRTFNQDSFSNFGDSGAGPEVDWSTPWSDSFPDENHPITAAETDVDYDGDQRIQALYGMLDLPLSPELSLVGGLRFESTKIGIVNTAESQANWFPPGSTAPVQLNPGDADVDFSQNDVLPSIGLTWSPRPEYTLRSSISGTIARQTFKELTPVIQQEFLGGPIFIGNPDLGMSKLINYDLRFDYRPRPSSLVSLSWFYKDVTDPIENVQRIDLFDYTTVVNYPKGRLSGLELELRQDLEDLWAPARGFRVGANATVIDSKVNLPDDEIAAFADPSINAPITSRDMTNAPAYLYNLNLTYDFEDTGTQLGLFYTVKGDTLVAGAGEASGNFIPSVYARPVGNLNFSFSQRLGDRWRLQVAAKNLTNSKIEEVYRSDYIDGDVVKTSYSKGTELSISLTASL